MTEIKKYCDHCGVKLNSNIDYCGARIALNHIGIETDLCIDCFKALNNNVVKFVKRDTQRIIKVCSEPKGGTNEN